MTENVERWVKSIFIVSIDGQITDKNSSYYIRGILRLPYYLSSFQQQHVSNTVLLVFSLILSGDT